MHDHGVRFHRIRFDRADQLASPIRIDPADIHVWGFILDIETSDLTRALAMLSDEERTRADRLVSEQHRGRLITAHAGLRVILSRYSEHFPQDLVIKKTRTGKPYLRDIPSLCFNLTHSHGRALVAVATGLEVGIDLEKVRQETDVLGLAKRFLSGADQAFIESGKPVQRHERFLQTWVAREAVFKAKGTGMTFPLHHDHVELTGDGTAGRVVRDTGASEETIGSVRFLALEPGWIGAVAAEGANWRVVYRG